VVSLEGSHRISVPHGDECIPHAVPAHGRRGKASFQAGRPPRS
jgi:hypothetical protein